MTRTAVLLLALLALAAGPLRAQSAPAFAAASLAPLPARLQPGADTGRRTGPGAEPRDELLRVTAVGMVVGCVLVGALTYIGSGGDDDERGTPDSGRTSNQALSDGLLGCAFGTFAGGVAAFTFTSLKQAMAGR